MNKRDFHIMNFWRDVLGLNRKKSQRERSGIRGFVEVILINPETGATRKFITHNIVTNAGDTYYAQKGAGEAVTYDFTAGGLKLGSDDTAPTKADTDVTVYLTSTYKAIYAGYPKTNDVLGTGGPDKVTWAYYYDTSEANGVNIKEFAIVNKLATPDAALCHGLFGATIVKTDRECLTVIIHHEMNGE